MPVALPKFADKAQLDTWFNATFPDVNHRTYSASYFEGLPDVETYLLERGKQATRAGKDAWALPAPPAGSDTSSDQWETPGSSPSSCSGPSPDLDFVRDPLADDDDSLADAALRILRWLQLNQPVPHPEDDDADSPSDDDRRGVCILFLVQ
ncbi:hypothetical protein IscW_ISCW006083 [Ixodes scapularis]|uniref:Uncharacterized protein n=1 Tax=Ixodes scapularis TaxID=6945 RepID=B7PP58_IXOSC|nr:hypothetical protein IscW_ISCW006083 [Ixodes scapularis]|eukprot:XP_002435550.1 hypothetical protein IscW_ISCW006083 [Ixodes scapularis]